MNTEFKSEFEKLTGFPPFKWQEEFGLTDNCSNRLIRIPTGFGKTAGVLAAWAWHRIIKHNDGWPRRLVWCLPMRVLVEQTENEVRLALKRLGVLWEEDGADDDKVGVHLLMGGAAAGQWHLYPERNAVLIGTQDMLLSRAMNRGYASPRARWPMEFGLLNQDALWVMDEVQLMDVGLATSGQLQVFRNGDQLAKKTMRPCFTWWMSATLQPEWLEKSPDTTDLLSELKQKTHRIEPANRTGHLWDDVQKPLELINTKKNRMLAEEISQRHRNPGVGNDGPTLVVFNTVMRATEVWKMLKKDTKLNGTDIRLVHSRFRPYERKTWRDDFLNREACSHGINRIIVSTQVIEAGVDLSASLLVTELAPWASLVQRFGRCARWGGIGKVVVADFKHDNDRKAAPYTLDELAAAHKACEALLNVAPSQLEHFEETYNEPLSSLYPYQPLHLLLRHELNELFDTTPDLSGADIDISRFIRSDDERDVHVFWDEIGDNKPASDRKPTHSELCNVPFLSAREWLCRDKSQGLKPGVYAWVWDWLKREWRTARRNDLCPGQTILVGSKTGGYHEEQGWDPDSQEWVSPVGTVEEVSYREQLCWKRDGEGCLPSKKNVRKLLSEDHADAAEDDESLSITKDWQTIASHGLQVAEEVQRIASQIIPMQSKLLHLAGRWHDLGKVHPAFQSSIQAENRPNRDDIAKAPDMAWPCSTNNMYRIDSKDQRRGFRHELASTLGLFGVLQRHNQDHPALLGPWRELLGSLNETNSAIVNLRGDTSGEEQLRTEPSSIEQEILDLNNEEFDLVAYLVCAHHGKVRMTWHSSPADQKANDSRLRIRGIREGDILPPLLLADNDGDFRELPATLVDLSPAAAGLSPRTGKSWTERVLGLLGRFGPFTLAWLEAILRAADQRASHKTFTDILLETTHARHELDTSHRTLAQPADGGAQTSPSPSDSSSRSQLNGDGGRTGRRDMDSGTTRPPHSATRYVETSVGILSYKELAPLLAERVADTELTISNRMFAELPIHALLLELHRRICADLTPNIAGRWRLRDVRVGEHQAPPHWQVPMMMHNYAADLEARLNGMNDNPTEQLIETLVFAEGRFLHIHPFEDFNGRVTRLFLIELMYRTNLPVIDPATSSDKETQQYFTALHACDRNDTGPLAAIWRKRFGHEV